MPIRPSDLTVFNKASITSLKLAFAELSKNFDDECFLGEKNILKKDAAQKIDEQYSKSARKRKKNLHINVSEYIAASSLLHNMDGWTYFSQAISSLLRGDFNTAIHLLYYSELRSCMSFLASNGIGVFNTRHLIINKKGKVQLINKKISGKDRNQIGTHDFTWEALSNIIGNNNYLKIVFDNYYIEDITLNDWLEKFGVNESLRLTIARKFLLLLSFDLKHFSKDKDARNQVSYRPNNIVNNEKVKYLDIFTEIKKIWSFSKPITGKGEIMVDIILLSTLLQMAFKAVHPYKKSFRAANRQYLAKLSIMLDSFGLTESRKDQLKNIFNQSYEDIYESMALTDFKAPSFLTGILFRSFLFLRLSNNYNKTIIRSSTNINKEKLFFWWNPLGINLGLWESSLEPEEFQDLWEDIDMFADDFDSAVNTENLSTGSFWKKYSNLGFLISTCNRIGLWGLGV